MLSNEMIKDAVALACRAPSLHNSQPWQWVRNQGGLQLFLDSSRAVYTDETGREALISCGAALDHLRIALAAAGWRAVIERFPNPDNPQHLATVTFDPAEVTDDDCQRADAILVRHTDRLPLAAPDNWAAIEPLLFDSVSNAAGGAVRLDVMSEDARPSLAEASQLSESSRLYDGAYHAELDWWTAPFDVADGIPQSSLVSAAESDRVDVGRVFPVTGNGYRRADVGEDEAKIVLLSTAGDGRADAVACGEALSGILLECARMGLASCPLTHITEVPATRSLVAALIDNLALPQVLIRVGVAPVIEAYPPPTPRHPLSEVLRIEV
ncbi:MAG TPA: NAD(P)H nitroreductase [Mycobacterium sp.]|nr:NAD(P)H nitroreductase [Mycobacterium sp.]